MDGRAFCVIAGGFHIHAGRGFGRPRAGHRACRGKGSRGSRGRDIPFASELSAAATGALASTPGGRHHHGGESGSRDFVYTLRPSADVPGNSRRGLCLPLMAS